MEKAAAPSLPDHSQVIVFPPVIPLTGFLLGVALEWLVPIGPGITGSLRIIAHKSGSRRLPRGHHRVRVDDRDDEAGPHADSQRAHTHDAGGGRPIPLHPESDVRVWIHLVRGPGAAARRTVVARVVDRSHRCHARRCGAQRRGVPRAPIWRRVSQIQSSRPSLLVRNPGSPPHNRASRLHCRTGWPRDSAIAPSAKEFATGLPSRHVKGRFANSVRSRAGESETAGKTGSAWIMLLTGTFSHGGFDQAAAWSV